MEIQENKEYIAQKINPIYQRLLTDLLLIKPDDTVDYMINWLKTKGQQFNQTFQTTTTLQNFQTKHKVQKNEEQVDSDSESDEIDDEYDNKYIQNIEINKNKNVQGRTSVSAEAFGKYHKKENFKAKKIAKNQQQKDQISKRLQQAFMFSALDNKEREIVIDAMEEKKFNAGDTVITQGEDGDMLYVVEKGTLDCYKKFHKDQKQPTYLKTYIPGESFGELALLYNAPRAATIKANITAICFGLDRSTFNHIVKDAAAKKREKYEGFLGSVDLLKGIDSYERGQIADALKTVTCKKNDIVIKQGDQGDTFFMIEEGELVAKKSTDGKQEREVMTYKPGMFFGELALQHNAPRAASIIAITDCKLLVLDRYSFKRLLGPVDDLLSKTKKKYTK